MARPPTPWIAPSAHATSALSLLAVQAMGVEEATPRSIAAAEALAMDLKHILDEASSTKLPSETDDELAAAAASRKSSAPLNSVNDSARVGGDSARVNKKKRAAKKGAKTVHDENDKENIPPSASTQLHNQQPPKNKQPTTAKPKFDMSTLANAKPPLGGQSSARSSARSSQRAAISSKGLASRAI